MSGRGTETPSTRVKRKEKSFTGAGCVSFTCPQILGHSSLRQVALNTPLLGAGFSCASLVAQRLKCLPGMWETLVRSLSWEDPLEKEMATHSSTPA